MTAYLARHKRGRSASADGAAARANAVSTSALIDAAATGYGGPESTAQYGSVALATVPAATMTEGALSEPSALGREMGKGLAWSLFNNVIGRLGNFLSGIVIVRILSPEQYGTYAVGLVVLTVLLSMNELGVSVAIVQRKGSVDSIAPTVVTLSILSSFVLATFAFLAAPFVASTLDAPGATGLIRLLVLGVVIDGITAVPNALITRAFEQRKRLLIDTIAFLVGTPLTIGLAVSGHGAWSLGWGAVVGNVVSGVLALAWAPARYRPGWERPAAVELLRFGLPLAGASLLLFVMLNVDYIVVGHNLGSTQLGYYLLAFNLCSWPITVITTAIRRITLAAFSRMRESPDLGRSGFERTAGLVMALTLPMCVMLAGYAEPIVSTLYGQRWDPAAQAVRLLTVLSLGRVAVELTYDFLAAAGRTSSNLALHAVWLAALIPALIVGSHHSGITGVAAGHAIVVCLIVLPMLGMLLRRAGISLLGLLRMTLPALFGAALIGLTLIPVTRLVSNSIGELVVGAAAASVVYTVAILPMRHTARALWNLTVS